MKTVNGKKKWKEKLEYEKKSESIKPIKNITATELIKIIQNNCEIENGDFCSLTCRKEQ